VDNQPLIEPKLAGKSQPEVKLGQCLRPDDVIQPRKAFFQHLHEQFGQITDEQWAKPHIGEARRWLACTEIFEEELRK
jgi:hypothetical protein